MQPGVDSGQEAVSAGTESTVNETNLSSGLLDYNGIKLKVNAYYLDVVRLSSCSW